MQFDGTNLGTDYKLFVAKHSSSLGETWIEETSVCNTAGQSYGIAVETDEDSYFQVGSIDQSSLTFGSSTLNVSLAYKYSIFSNRGVDHGSTSTFKIAPNSDNTSITGFSSDDLGVYPNPSDGSSLSLYGLKDNVKYQFYIMDLSGKLIQHNSNITNGPIIISENLVPGVYFLTVSSDKAKGFTTRIMIE